MSRFFKVSESESQPSSEKEGREHESYLADMVHHFNFKMEIYLLRLMGKVLVLKNLGLKL